MNDNPRRAEIERAMAGFQDRADRGKVPTHRRYARVVGGVVGSHKHQQRKRNRQRRDAYNWTPRRGT